MYDLSGLELSEETQAQLDSLYEKDGRHPVLSKMVALSAFGVSEVPKPRSILCTKRMAAGSSCPSSTICRRLVLRRVPKAQLDSLYEKSARSLNIYRC